ncbi:SdpI family protein [Staphylococcus ursi]|uniref:SdpI family protein n=1 Tax=Staphylococcus sp. MI 10-1553 TaxID=1912064 RepID=UPI001EEFD6DB|nr:SdpI family protein [Staphylococcus sp. MI 10-1553]
MILLPSSLFLFLLAIVFQHIVSQKINYFFGFRTRKTMKNQKNWEIAQVSFVRQLKVILDIRLYIQFYYALRISCSLF